MCPAQHSTRIGTSFTRSFYHRHAFQCHPAHPVLRTEEPIYAAPVLNAISSILVFVAACWRRRIPAPLPPPEQLAFDLDQITQGRLQLRGGLPVRSADLSSLGSRERNLIGVKGLAEAERAERASQYWLRGPTRPRLDGAGIARRARLAPPARRQRWQSVLGAPRLSRLHSHSSRLTALACQLRGRAGDAPVSERDSRL